MEGRNCEIHDFIRIDSPSKMDVRRVLEIQKETNLTVWRESDYENEIDKHDSLCFVARIDNNTVEAFAIVKLLLGEAGQFDTAEILNIAVAEEFQRQKVGQALFDRIHNDLSKKGVSEVWLEVRKSNEKAISFYCKNGFVKEFERKNYYTDPVEDASIFKLAL